jgi:ParB/Sulfiredoxin domain
MVTTQLIAIDALKPSARNGRTHSKKQIRQIADSIVAFGFVSPILVDESGVIVAGHGRHAAARLLELKQVPGIELRGLSEAKRRALAIADNKIAENAGWDRELLALELPELAEILLEDGLDISITGFAPVEIDQITADTVDSDWTTAAPVSESGDLWELGGHRLLCGDARNADHLTRLMGELAPRWRSWSQNAQNQWRIPGRYRSSAPGFEEVEGGSKSKPFIGRAAAAAPRLCDFATELSWYSISPEGEELGSNILQLSPRTHVKQHEKHASAYCDSTNRLGSRRSGEAREQDAIKKWPG